MSRPSSSLRADPHAYVQVLPDDVDESVVASRYGLTATWGESVDETGAHDVIEFSGPRSAVERFVEMELDGGYSVHD
jgi:hypothetical protein